MELTFTLPQVIRSKQEVMEDFVGPLDLILDLLRRDKIEIRDLSLASLLEQYLQWIDLRQSLDLEVASEFIAMASHLVYLKTRMLLSVGEEGDKELDELMNILEERRSQERMLKTTAGRELLESRLELVRSIFLTPRKALEHEEKSLRYSHKPGELMSALRNVFERSERRIPPPPTIFNAIVGREPYPVEDKIEEILTRLEKRGKTALRLLFEDTVSKSELVAAFLAVLELCRNGVLNVQDADGEIFLTMN